MEHVTTTPTASGQYRLKADLGYLLKSKVTGNVYPEIDTRDLKRWEVIEEEKKAEVKTPKRTRAKTAK